MLASLQADSLDQLCSETVPSTIRLQTDMDLPTAMSEAAYSRHIDELGAKNKINKSYIGLGYHPTHLPET